MKRLLFLFVSAFMAAASSFASVTGNVSSFISNDNNESVVKKQSEKNGPLLVLKKMTNLDSTVQAHYSHSSHQSHESHSSHRSHYSSR